MVQEGPQADPQPMQTSVKDEDSIGVALAGGGVRAAMYSLGALMYLVDSGYCQYVTEMSSVSGGSITNAFIGQRINFQKAHEHPREFDDVAKDLARTLTEKSLLPVGRIIAAYVTVAALELLALHYIWVRLDLGWLGSLGRALVLVASLLLFGVLWMLRGAYLSVRLNRLLFSNDSSAPTTISTLKSDITHVICATDLNSGQPFYFTNFADCIMGNYRWGFWKCEGLPLTSAVRASAAFPAAFPPKWLRLSKASRADAAVDEARRRLTHENPPESVFLVDGGVWNNIATSWFEEDRPLSALYTRKVQFRPKRLLVVNATAPFRRRTTLPLLGLPFGEVVGLTRVIDILLSSTIAPRVTSLTDWQRMISLGVRVFPAVINIDHDHWGDPRSSALNLALRLTSDTQAAKDVNERASQPPPFELKLTSYTDWSPQRLLWGFLFEIPRYQVSRLMKWILPSLSLRPGTGTQKDVILSEAAARVPTVLWRISRGDGMTLLMHGYFSAWRTMEVLFGKKPMRLPDIKRFTNIAGVKYAKAWWTSEGERKILRGTPDGTLENVSWKPLVFQIHFTEDRWGTHEQLPPIPTTTEQLGHLDLLYQTGARIGDPEAMVKLSFRLADEGNLQLAVDWYLKALQAEYPATFHNLLKLLRMPANAGEMQTEELLKKECGSGAVALLFKLAEPDRRAFIHGIDEALRGN